MNTINMMKSYLRNDIITVGSVIGNSYFRKTAVRRAREYTFRQFAALFRGEEIDIGDGILEFWDDDVEEES